MASTGLVYGPDVTHPARALSLIHQRDIATAVELALPGATDGHVVNIVDEAPTTAGAYRRRKDPSSPVTGRSGPTPPTTGPRRPPPRRAGPARPRSGFEPRCSSGLPRPVRS
jgi:hypothetical protein